MHRIVIANNSNYLKNETLIIGYNLLASCFRRYLRCMFNGPSKWKDRPLCSVGASSDIDASFAMFYKIHRQCL